MFRDLGYEVENQPIITHEFLLFIGNVVDFFSQGMALLLMKNVMTDVYNNIKRSF